MWGWVEYGAAPIPHPTSPLKGEEFETHTVSIFDELQIILRAEAPKFTPINANLDIPPFQGEGQGGDGFHVRRSPIPLPASPLKGEEHKEVRG